MAFKSVGFNLTLSAIATASRNFGIPQIICWAIWPQTPSLHIDSDI